jgi:hypothetical protein
MQTSTARAYHVTCSGRSDLHNRALRLLQHAGNEDFEGVEEAEDVHLVGRLPVRRRACTQPASQGARTNRTVAAAGRCARERATCQDGAAGEQHPRVCGQELDGRGGKMLRDPPQQPLHALHGCHVAHEPNNLSHVRNGEGAE